MKEWEISIHLMLWFNLIQVHNLPQNKIFQYILCYGSTQAWITYEKRLNQFQYILCYGSTHLLTSVWKKSK